jgi:nucleoside-diphosphate-sugar epimerase
MKILITGGCGYVGTVLTEALLEAKHEIVVVDNQWFGNYLKPNSNLINIKADIRDLDLIPMENVDVVIHLANIANDPAVDLNPTLSWEVNVLSSQQLAEKAIKNGVKQFIYASSGSVYGVKDESDVTEDLDLVPISVYNKTKMVAERVLLSYRDKIKVHCIRPATVCGLSPRMRLDVSVNMLTFQALKHKKITVFGGDQTRPNIHIKDMVRVYEHFINNSMIESGCYNAGFENISILEIAKLVQNLIETGISVSSSNDPRSYRQNSDKLLKTGFEKKYSVEDAIHEIKLAYENNEIIETEQCYTVKLMKSLNL